MGKTTGYEGLETSLIVLGAPGLGKSSLLGSITEIVPPEEVLLLVTKPGEESSWSYRKSGLYQTSELYHDWHWSKVLAKLQADAYVKLYQRLVGLQQDEKYHAVLIDPGTDAIALLEHYLIKDTGVASPGDLKDSSGESQMRSFYRQLKDEAEDFVKVAAVLSTKYVKRPKWVLISWHCQPPKEGESRKVLVEGGRTAYQKTESADERKAGIEYYGEVLPMIEGGYRTKLQADVDLIVFADVKQSTVFDKGKRMDRTDYVIQVGPSKERHAKVRIAPSLTQQYLPNTMKALLDAVKEAK